MVFHLKRQELKPLIKTGGFGWPYASRFKCMQAAAKKRGYAFFTPFSVLKDADKTSF
jgi:hypothetical protein